MPTMYEPLIEKLCPEGIIAKTELSRSYVIRILEKNVIDISILYVFETWNTLFFEYFLKIAAGIVLAEFCAIASLITLISTRKYRFTLNTTQIYGAEKYAFLRWAPKEGLSGEELKFAY
ncbi:unnamed protein product [Acanthoscelides obtectus]|uniref:Uncharacterized protein n=1 Tax=Acanthoscelides obtectus TaxID=200917 RepID=A0A9P0P0I3_ACAOB|nr:unnamed protein product [Acanthoscelides obtectus]CAK1621880.1 hypothetical protein AOBTE_LOCUS1196 [Acanthoscelides obtectus]